METIIKNGKENIWITVNERDGGTVTVTSATFQVFDSSDTSVQASASATIADNSTASPDIYGLVDTSVAGFVACNTYYVLFLVTIGTEVLPFERAFKVV